METGRKSLVRLNLDRALTVEEAKPLGSDTLYVAVPFETPAVQGVIRVATPLALVDQAVSQMRLLLVFACLLGLVIAILVSWVASYLSARRLRNLIRSSPDYG